MLISLLGASFCFTYAFSAMRALFFSLSISFPLWPLYPEDIIRKQFILLGKVTFYFIYSKPSLM